MIEIRPMARADLRSVVAIHRAAFPDFFLSDLGPAFLRVFYEFVAEEGIALVAVAEDRRVAGFVAGVLHPRSFYQQLLRRRYVQVALALVPPTLRRPSTLIRVARRARQRTAADGQTPSGAELMSLAVDPARRQQGVGRALVEAFTARAGRLWLTTDAADNAEVIHFYENLRFTRTRAYITSEGRAVVELSR